MGTYLVIHMAEWKTLWGEAEILENMKKSTYDVVAKVEARNLDEVFYLTNNIDSSWVENPGVTPAPGRGLGCRSSSVGDVFWDMDEKAAYAVLPCGFSKPIENLCLGNGEGLWWLYVT